MQTIFTEKAPKPVGAYSQAIVTDEFVFISGQLGIDPSTGELLEGLDSQFRRILENVQAILEACGLGLDDVVKTTIFLTDMGNCSVVNDIYSKAFKEPYPARSVVGVSSLPKGALVEMEVIARRK